MSHHLLSLETLDLPRGVFSAFYYFLALINSPLLPPKNSILKYVDDTGVAGLMGANKV